MNKPEHRIDCKNCGISVTSFKKETSKIVIWICSILSLLTFLGGLAVVAGQNINKIDNLNKVSDTAITTMIQYETDTNQRLSVLEKQEYMLTSIKQDVTEIKKVLFQMAGKNNQVSFVGPPESDNRKN